jgi:hypothetical protein
VFPNSSSGSWTQRTWRPAAAPTAAAN